jgi:dTDP-4-amino-4,6-dideoxygalactose transaminase
MDKIMDIARRHNLHVVEDAAQAIESFYTGRDGVRRPLGSIGHLAAFSFHETKNIMSGEGGMLAINDDRFVERAEIIREKGTNRSKFFRGELDKYGWVDIGSSFLPSDIIAAFLYAQLENLDDIQTRRTQIWNTYRTRLEGASNKFTLPYLPSYASNNAHMFYLVCNSIEDRTNLIARLKEKSVRAVYHYLSLHKSEYYQDKYNGGELPETDRYTDCLVRLPMFYELTDEEMDTIVTTLREL